MRPLLAPGSPTTRELEPKPSLAGSAASPQLLDGWTQAAICQSLLHLPPQTPRGQGWLSLKVRSPHRALHKALHTELCTIIAQ